MPHFYFHLHDGQARREDRRGIDLPDAEAAWYQAYRSARELLAVDARRGGDLIAHVFEVEDDRGAAVWRVPIAEIAEVAR